ncbi:hypothetical protein B0H13DRAFT_1520366, partial [Mycena leptocephala]
PMGFLFLCPAADFKTGPTSFCWPKLPAYWSLDPSGFQDCYSLEEATSLGFDSVQSTTELHGYSWDESVYAGHRQLQHAKGFNPDTQDLARHLGHPLYQL